MIRIRRVLLVCAAFLMLRPALAWHDTGHMVIAAIAYKRLTPRVKATVDALLQGGDPRSSDFVSAACWADDTKNRTTARWHYIDLYFRSDGVATDLKAEPENVVWAINKFSAQLARKASGKAGRSTALRYLIHFVGDIHQPLHTASFVSIDHPTGDRGGNAFKIKPPHEMPSRPRNLHSLWDSGGGLFSHIGRPLDSDAHREINTIATQLGDRYQSVAATAARELRPGIWALEGERICESNVYQLEENTVISNGYLETVQDVSSKRATIAGYRLAALLNKILG